MGEGFDRAIEPKKSQTIGGEDSVNASSLWASFDRTSAKTGDEKSNQMKVDVAQAGAAATGADANKPSACDNGFEMSKDCIAERGLTGKVDAFQQHLMDAQKKLGTGYKIDLKVVDRAMWGPYGTPLDSDVWTNVVRDKDMRNESFVVHVTGKFLNEQPDILFESSTAHEVCHIMNDDLPGYHRQGANIEVAEERCVANAVGMPRYEEYLKAYFQYKPKTNPPFDQMLQRVKDVQLVPPPIESDDADKKAIEFFKANNDGKEHLLVYNGDLHDITLSSTRDSVKHDPAKLDAVIKAGKPMTFFHNHPAEDGRAAQFPSMDDYGVAGLHSFTVFKQNPNIPVDFRVVQLGDKVSDVSYGFKKSVVDEIKKNAQAYNDAMARNEDPAPIEMKQKIFNYHLTRDSYNEYLKNACSIEQMRQGKNVCTTQAQYFLWPSEKFFLKDRPQP